MALDLAHEHTVFLADFEAERLKSVKKLDTSIHTHILNVNNTKAVQKFVISADIVLLAVPGFLGFKALHTIIKSEKNIVDISFSLENIFTLDTLAKENNITAIVDAGLAPGIPNYLLGYHHNQMKIDTFEYLVGGLPKYPQPPHNYKAPFSPIDVIAEYTRPARMKIQGKIVTKPALSDIEEIEYENVGKLEAFNTDGLRSILTTMAYIPNMKEKTLRYPGHAALMKTFSDLGKFDSKSLDKTTKELAAAWKLNHREPEFTLLDVFISSKKEKIHYQLYDEYNPGSNMTSMSRTTGYTATATINLLLNGLFSAKGVFPPELVGKTPGCWTYVNNYLLDRAIYIRKKLIDVDSTLQSVQY